MFTAIQATPFVLLAAGLFAFATWKPWAGLAVLLTLLPFNGVLLDVVAPTLGLRDPARLALGSWHDALAGGPILVAAYAIARRGLKTQPLILLAAGAVLALGVVALALAPYRLTGLYEYRTLYEPVVLMVAILIISGASAVPDWFRGRVGLLVTASAVLASLYAAVQVLLLGFRYIDHFYRVDGILPNAYVATYVSRPRAIGTFHSPNEFGAYLVVILGLLLVPGVLKIKPSYRAWALVAVTSALVLTLSRSAWIGAAVVVVLTPVLAGLTPLRLYRSARQIDRRTALRLVAPALAVFLIFNGYTMSTSGVPKYLVTTLTGHEPSAAGRSNTITDALDGGVGGPSPAPGSSAQIADGQSRVTMFGLGLGSAGPKSSRFGEGGDSPNVNSEMWYVNYLNSSGRRRERSNRLPGTHPVPGAVAA